jgi:DNA polymerase
VTVLHIDFETRSTVDLKKTGVYVYAEDPTTDVWCACYAIDDGPVHTWRPGQSPPAEIVEHVLDGEPIFAHNANFERVVWKHVLTPRYGWPEPTIDQWHCTMVAAYALALPGRLEDAAPALGLDERKDAAGGRLMLQMARPRKVEPLTWWDTPEKIERLIAYCRTDVEVERALTKRLRPLKPSELDLWRLDQQINDRGVFVDVALCEAAKKIVAATSERLDRRMAEVTGCAVRKCSNRNELIAWARSRGIDTESIAKDAIEELLAQELPNDVREALELRRESAKASVAKIDALLAGRSADGRARGLLQFHAASTGRWAGRRFQPQNIKRPTLKKKAVAAAIEIVLSGDVDLVDCIYGEPLSVVGDCLRGMIKAPPGRKILAIDYKAIESRVLAWLAGEKWKIEAHRAFDEGRGPEVYRVIGGDILNKKPEDLTDDERQAYGKVPDLALGYQGGVGAFQTMAVNYGVKLPDHEVERIRDSFRAKHVATKCFWRDLEDAAIRAVQQPGSTQVVRDIVFRVAGSFLFMRLPSKRFLAYPYPRVVPKLMPWTTDDGREVWKDSLTYFSTIDVSKRLKIVDDPNNSSKWARIATYGGMLAENATQAVARDVMAAAMSRLEAAGYEVILTVHDEIVSEVDRDFGSLDEMKRIASELPEWATGLPVATDGFEGERYRK